MGNSAIPRMTKPWMVAAIGMAAFGFVNGYVGTAGAPYCGSMGQCLQRVVDAGPPWFYPAALIPGVIAAAIFAAVVYVLFLAVYGVRAALGRTPAARTGQVAASDTGMTAETRESEGKDVVITVSRRTITLAIVLVCTFLVGGLVGYGLHPATTAEQTAAEVHARVQECVAQFQVTHLWPNSCPPIDPPKTEAEVAFESLCPSGWAWNPSTGATCYFPTPSPTLP